VCQHDDLPVEQPTKLELTINLKASSGAARWHDFGILATTMTVAGTGDYLGNGTSDILLWNPPNGDTGYYTVKNFGLDVSPFTHSACHDLGTTNPTYHIVS
jgi:hypothetical protein